MGPRGPEETSERERISRVKVLSYDRQNERGQILNEGVGEMGGRRIGREGKGEKEEVKFTYL